LAPGPAAGADITISVERRGDTIAIQASALLGVDPATAWRVLTDYGRYPEFIPGLTTSRVVARNGPTVTVEQDGHAQVWLLRVPVAVTYEITEAPPGRVRSRAVAGSLRLLDSDYRLTPLAAGVRLDYTGLAATGTGLFGPFEQWVIEQNATQRFRALADAMERAAR
jgi:ribosome-associated toxin RatA of RatAB toxin-antitoxin module